MSGDLTARDVIAQALSDWFETGQEPNPDDFSMADYAVAALAAAGWRLERDDQWEFGIRDDHWPGGPYISGGHTREDALTAAEVAPDLVAMRRRPAGEWEVAPDA